jgi:hypothetical protein
MSDKKEQEQEWNGNENKTGMEWWTITVTTTDNNYIGDNIIERFASVSFIAMVCKREKIFCFFFYFVFF